MTNAIRTTGCGALLALLALAGCSDRVTDTDAPHTPARLTIAAAIAGGAAGGPAAAYARADRLAVRVLVGGDLRLEQELPFDPAGAETMVPLEVPLRAVSETVSVELELRADTRPIFRGTGAALLTATTGNTVDMTLTPVVAGVACAGSVVQLAAYGETSRVPGFALFATGDSIPEAAVEWSTAHGTIVSINAAGDVTALQDGDAVVTCHASSFTDTRNVRVFAIVTAVEVTPPQATVEVGSAVSFSTAVRDARNNLITTPRPVAWSSADAAVAEVSAAGVAQGVSPGTIGIIATSGTASASAQLTVVFPPPAVTTTAAGGVQATGAALNALVDPRGAPTQAWFEWGTSASLASFTATPRQTAGNGQGPVTVSREIGGLLSNQTYFFRGVAESDGGFVRGGILSFTTHTVPTATTGAAEFGARTVIMQGSVNPEGLAAQAFFQWGSSPTLAGATTTAAQAIAAGRSGVPVQAVLSADGLQSGATYYYRMSASNTVGTGHGEILSFTVPLPPTVTTSGAVVQSRPRDSTECGLDDVCSGFVLTALLDGTVNPNGRPTQAGFEWSTSSSLAQASSTGPVNVGSGTSTLPFSQSTSTLQPGTTYYARAFADSDFGSATGGIISFTTPAGPPEATTGTSSWSVTSTATARTWTATMSATVMPNGAVSTAWIEYSADSTFTTFTRTAELSVGASYNVTTFIRTFSVNTGPDSSAPLMYYRAAASNLVGTVRGTTRIVGDLGLR
jgi:hypothetical protein